MRATSWNHGELLPYNRPRSLECLCLLPISLVVNIQGSVCFLTCLVLTLLLCNQWFMVSCRYTVHDYGFRIRRRVTPADETQNPEEAFKDFTDLKLLYKHHRRESLIFRLVLSHDG